MKENGPNIIAYDKISSDGIIQDFLNAVFQKTGRSEDNVL